MNQPVTPPGEPSLASSQYASTADLGDNAHYLGERLKFTKAGELEFAFIRTDGIVGAAMIKAFSRVVSVFVPFLLLGYLVAYLSDDPESIVTFMVIGVVVALGVFILTWLLPTRLPMSEWQLLVEGRAAAADSAYGAIYMTLRQRGIPVEVSARRIRSDLGSGGARNYLLVRQAPFTAYVGVFAYGNSLYLGWSLWRVQSPLSVLWNKVKTKVLAMVTQDNAGFRAFLSAEPAKALRESVHSATREGVQVASGGMSVPLHYAFGQEVPVTDLGVNPDQQGGGQGYPPAGQQHGTPQQHGAPQHSAPPQQYGTPQQHSVPSQQQSSSYGAPSGPAPTQAPDRQPAPTTTGQAPSDGSGQQPPAAAPASAPTSWNIPAAPQPPASGQDRKPNEG